MNKRKTGENYEVKAAEFLTSQGIKILEKNYRNRHGEIDLIGRDDTYLIFIEVKYRKDNNKGTPAEAVGFSKQKRICKVADFYRLTHGIGEFEAVRYDVIAYSNEEFEWYKNAFDHIY